MVAGSHEARGEVHGEGAEAEQAVQEHCWNRNIDWHSRWHSREKIIAEQTHD